MVRFRSLAALRAGPVTARTAVNRAHLLWLFEGWVAEAAPGCSLAVLAQENVPWLSTLLEEYGAATYEAQRSRSYYAGTVNAVASHYGWLRPFLSASWRLLTTWEALEPPQLHPPIPLRVLQALVVLALSWDWWEVALLLLLGFYGLLRPSEYIALTPSHMLVSEADPDVLLLRVDEPKTRLRGARHQYVRVDAALATRV